MDISIVVPTLQRQTLQVLINSIILQNYFELIIIHDKNRNWCAATRNRWAKKAKWDFIAFIDDDCIADKDYIQKWIEYLEKNPEIDLMQWKVYWWLESNEIMFFVWANLWIRTSVLEKLWYFNEKFSIWWDEDLELCWRLLENWYKVGWNPNCKVHHPTPEQHKKYDFTKSILKEKYPKRYEQLIKENRSYFITDKIKWINYI